MLAVTRLIIAFIILALASTVLGTAIGYQQARQSDERLLVEQHAALRNAISEFRSRFVRPDEIDPRLMRAIERIVGAGNIEFEVIPAQANAKRSR